jgi:hypothetical protein
VVTANPVAPGSACPPAARTAPAGSTRTLVICGRNRTSTALTPVDELSSLTGSFIDAAGTFAADSIPAGNAEVVLAQWTDTQIAATAGTGLKVTATLGVSATLTSGPRTFKGFSATTQSAPTADATSASGLEDGSQLPVTLTGRDVDGDGLTFDVGTATNGLVSEPGAVDCVGSSPSVCTTTVTYTPNANFYGDDSFTYTVSDGTVASSPATASVTVTGVNDAPSFTKGADVQAVAGGGPLTIADWATAISDGPANEGGQTHQFAVVADNPGLFDVAPAISPSGTLTFTPGASVGSTSVTVVLQDDGGTANGGADVSASQSFTITLVPSNAAPTAEATSATGLEDGGAVSVTLTGRDADGDGLTFDVGTASNGLVSVPGTVDCLGSSPSVCTTTVTYTPNADFFGADSFTYTVNDGTVDSSSATSSVSISGVNDAPSFTKGDDVTGSEDSPEQVYEGWASAISAGPANEGSQNLGFVVTTDNDPLFSTLAVDADGNLRFTPAVDANGVATVSVRLADDGGTANGGVDESGVQTFTITVAAVNDTPSFTKGADQAVSEDAGAHSVSNWATAISKGPADESGQTLTFDVSNDNNALFAAQPAVSPTGTLTFTPAANGSGVAVVSVVLSDDGGTDLRGDDTSDVQTFTISVGNVNDEPSFSHSGDQTVLEDAGVQTVSGFVTSTSAGPGDESGQTVTVSVTDVNNVSLFSVPPAIDAAGTLTYTPAADANGVAAVTARAFDDAGTANGGDDTGPELTFTITVTAINDVPSFTKGADQVVNEDAGAQSASGWATAISKGPADESGQSLSFTTSNDNNGLFSVQPGLTPTGTLVYTPASNRIGTATISITLSDNGGTANGGDDTSDTQTFVITVGAVNDEPGFTHAGNMTVLEGAGAQTVSGFVTATSAGPSDEAGQGVTVSVVDVTNVSLFSVPPAINSAGTLTYTPAADANGTTSVTARAVDDGGTANGGDDTGPDVTFTITVTAVNDEPSFTKGVDQVVGEDAGAQSVSNWATAISKGPADESAQSLSFVVTNDNNALFSAQPAVSPTGTLTFTSAPNKYGSATVTVVLSDNGGTAGGGDDTSQAQTFNISVNPVNDAPVAAAKSFTVQANMKISLSGLLTGASDPNDVAGDPGWTPSFSVGSVTPGAGCIGCTVSNVNQAAGTFDFDPPAGGTGTYTISYTVVDNGHPGPGTASAPQTITLTVNGPVVWFVDADASFNGTGRLSAPFNNLASATAAASTNPNQRIFVEDGNVAGNVTLQTNGWLISDAATGPNFDSVMGFAPPAGTIARPAVNSGSQRTLTGTVTLADSSVVRGFNLTPTSGNRGLVGSGADGVTVDQMSITTTSARAVDLDSSSGVFSLTRVSATGGDRGISLVSTNTSGGSFEITGTGTAGSGGVISDSTGTVAGIYFQATRNVTLRWMTVSSNAADGIYGTNVTDLVLQDSTFRGNGTAHFHSGFQFTNLLGTSSIDRVDAEGLGYAAGQIGNASGSATITVADSTFRAATHGLHIGSDASSSVTFTSTSNTFLNAIGNGLAITSSSSQPMTATINGGTYSSNDTGLFLWNTGPSVLGFSSSGGTLVGCPTCSVGVQVTQNSTGTIVGTIQGMTASNVASGVDVNGSGPGTMRLALTNNHLTQVRTTGIDVFLDNTTASAATADLAITGNAITQSAANGQSSIAVSAGGVSGSGVNACAHIATNAITNPVNYDILVWNRSAPTTFRLPGYVGAPTDTNSVRNFLIGQNGATDASATNGSSASGFGGGAACQAP